MLSQDVGPQKTADQTPLLHDAEPAVVCESPTPELEHAGELEDANPIPANITNRLYISHFLSTWNSRVFEFGAVLYLATIYPGTLLPLSIYALSRGLAAIIFAPVVGHYIDVGNRLSVVRFSIGRCLHHDLVNQYTSPANESLWHYQFCNGLLWLHPVSFSTCSQSDRR